MTNDEILSLSVDSYEMTVRDFLKECLCKLIVEGECFSGKRPLGNSDWQHDIAATLIEAGVLKGVKEEWDEYTFDFQTFDDLMVNLIVEEF